MDIARGPVAHSGRKSGFDAEIIWRLGRDAPELAPSGWAGSDAVTRKNRPRGFDPAAVPDDVLPKIPA